MPLTVLCPTCSARITAPDRLAGKTVKCPKCQTAFALPAADAGFEVVEDDEPVVAQVKPKPPASESGFEVVEDDEPVVASVKPKKNVQAQAFEVVEDDEPVPSKPRKKSRPSVIEEEDQELPARKKGKAKKGLSPLWLYGSIVGILLLIGLAVGVYFLIAGKGGGQANPTWHKFDDPNGKFVAFFPDGPPNVTEPESIIGGGNNRSRPNRAGEMEQMGFKTSAWSRDVGDRKYALAIMQVPQAIAAQFTLDVFTKEITSKGGQTETKRTTVSGIEAYQESTKRSDGVFLLGTILVHDGRAYFLVIQSKEKIKLDDAAYVKFVEQFRLNK
jgi:hypothetical protein